MRTLIFMLIVMALWVTSAAASLPQLGSSVQVCEQGGQYVVLVPGAQCGGTVETGTVVEVSDGHIVLMTAEGKQLEAKPAN